MLYFDPSISNLWQSRAAMEGGAPFAWEPYLQVKIGVLARNGGSSENIR